MSGKRMSTSNRAKMMLLVNQPPVETNSYCSELNING